MIRVEDRAAGNVDGTPEENTVMSPPPFEVTRKADTIAVRGRINAELMHVFMRALRELEAASERDCVLDFSHCDSAWPDGTVPLAAAIDAWRARGFRFALRLPGHPAMASYVVRTNLAHFVEPGTYPLHTAHVQRHVPIRRFETLEEQVAVVNELIEVFLRTMALPRDVLQGLEWSINEVMDNVLNHAQAPRGGFVQATTTEDRVSFAVADCGIGILASLREGYPKLSSDSDAIGEAIKVGVTRNPQAGQGNGLAGTLSIATQTGGSLSIMSGRGMLNVYSDAHGVRSRRLPCPEDQALVGTAVSAQVFRAADFRMERALGFTKVQGGTVDLIESRYEIGPGDAFLVKLAEETTGFGSRESGRQIRTKCLNLLNADPSKALIVDWTGVPVVSSSFADELMGKLFVALGPIGFTARIRNVRMENLIRQLVDKAIMQRLAQTSEED